MDRFKLSNTRLLYKKNTLDASWIKELAVLDLAIEEHPRVQKASQAFHLYFFKPGKELSSSDELWVAREITGFVNPGELPGMETYDLGKGTYFGKESQMGEELQLEELLEQEQSLREASEKEFASTWRVSFFRENGLLKRRIGLF